MNTKPQKDTSVQSDMTTGYKSVLWVEEKRTFYTQNPRNLFIPLFAEPSQAQKNNSDIFNY
jgi:hypothetical protein